MPTPHLYFWEPVPIFKARVNMPGSITYPLSSLTYDSVTLGAFGDVAFDATLLLGTSEGADDLGRVRVKSVPTSSSIPVARASRGIEDGQLDVQDNAYITILDDYRIWAKVPYFDLDAGIDYKDGDVPPGTFNTNIPPVANTGPGFADYISSGVITVDFDGSGSYAVADGATLTGYAWDIADGTLVSGSLSTATFTATFPAGKRYVALTVTDSNGVTHTARCPVLAIDPAADDTIKNFGLTQRLTISGQTLDIELYEDSPRTTYPDGTLVLFWWDNPIAPDRRDHMKFIGWLDSENFSLSRQKKGLVRSTQLRAVDGMGRLAKLPGFPQALERIFDEAQWSLMPDLDMSKALFYIAFWHSTLINIVDFFLPEGGEAYDSVRIDASGGNLKDQLEGLANKIVPDHFLCCNSKGQVSFLPNWLLQDEVDRPEVDPILIEEDYGDLQAEYDRHPKVHVLRSGAILVHTELVVIDGVETVPLVFSVAPSDAQAFGQGTVEQVEPEGLALSQESLNICEGHRYAMINSRHGRYNFTDPRGTLFWAFEPALLKRVQLELAAAYAAQRGLDWTVASGQIQEITVNYNTSKKGFAIQPHISWIKETSGYPASTYVPDEAEPIDYEPPPGFTPPLPNDPTYYYDDINAYVLWDGTNVLRTWDLQGAPVWELITGTLSGTIYDIQYMHVDAATVGAWCMTSTGIYFCDDIMAVTPTWDEVLSITTVRAEVAAPASGLVIFGSMAHYWLQPGHLCVALSLDTENDDYTHQYYYVTEDYGVNWTSVDEDDYLFTSSGATRGYYFASRYSLAAFRSEPILWCGRTNGRTGTNAGDGAVFKSIDGGFNWTKEYIITPTGRTTSVAMLHPFPDIGDPSYLVTAVGGTTPVGKTYLSEVAWSPSANLLTEPAGHDGAFAIGGHMMRPNKDPFRDDHVIEIFKIDGSSAGDLYESTDKGVNWTLLENLNNSTNTPNGWPPDPDQWVIIDNAPAAVHVRLTLDNFATFIDKSGNIDTLITWTTGSFANGFALPKIFPNV